MSVEVLRRKLEILLRLDRIEAALHVAPDETLSADIEGLRRSFD